MAIDQASIEALKSGTRQGYRQLREGRTAGEGCAFGVWCAAASAMGPCRISAARFGVAARTPTRLWRVILREVAGHRSPFRPQAAPCVAS